MVAKSKVAKSRAAKNVSIILNVEKNIKINMAFSISGVNNKLHLGNNSLCCSGLLGRQNVRHVRVISNHSKHASSPCGHQDCSMGNGAHSHDQVRPWICSNCSPTWAQPPLQDWAKVEDGNKGLHWISSPPSHTSPCSHHSFLPIRAWPHRVAHQHRRFNHPPLCILLENMLEQSFQAFLGIQCNAHRRGFSVRGDGYNFVF